MSTCTISLIARVVNESMRYSIKAGSPEKIVSDCIKLVAESTKIVDKNTKNVVES